jgi:TDG/mug DNA glycosylase family protein
VTRPSKADLVAAAGGTIPDVICPDLRVLFVGINPGLYSAATGRHFARPGNRFWPALHLSGFTPRRFHPSEQADLLSLGLGITNLVDRGTARADELTRAELVAGGAALVSKVERFRPRVVAIVGVTAYRTAFGQPGAVVGPAPLPLGRARGWILPNPSGLNAHFQLDRLAAEFRALHDAADGSPATRRASTP